MLAPSESQGFRMPTSSKVVLIDLIVNALSS